MTPTRPGRHALPPRVSALVLLLCVLLLPCAGCEPPAPQLVDDATRPTPAARAARQTEAHAGPRPQAIPAGAVVARDGDHLRALLADPRGPTEIWLQGRVYTGDLHVTRPVAVRGATGAVLQGSGTGTVVLVEAEGAELDNVTVRGSGGKHTTEDAAVKVKGKRNVVRHVWADRTLFGISLQLCKECQVLDTKVTGAGAETGTGTGAGTGTGTGTGTGDGAGAGARPGHGGAQLLGDAIKLWEAHDGVVARCFVENSRDVVVWYSRRTHLEANVVKGSRYGTHFMYAHDAVVRHSRVIGNVVGIFVMYSARLRVEDNELAGARGAAGVGLGFKDSDAVEVHGNWIVGNSTGTYLDRTPVTPGKVVTFSGNVLALNDVALRLHASQSDAHFFGNDFHRNAVTAEVDGGGDALGLTFRGNHWSDYAGYDLDHDGRGDVAFEISRLSSELTDARPSLRLLQGTLALGLFDAVARALPIFASHKLLVDPEPAMDPGPLVGRAPVRPAPTRPAPTAPAAALAPPAGQVAQETP